TRPLSQSHDAQPQRHNAYRRHGGVQHGELCHLEALIGDFLEPVAAAAEDHGQHNEREPDVVEHGPTLYAAWKSWRGKSKVGQGAGGPAEFLSDRIPPTTWCPVHKGGHLSCKHGGCHVKNG